MSHLKLSVSVNEFPCRIRRHLRDLRGSSRWLRCLFLYLLFFRLLYNSDGPYPRSTWPGIIDRSLIFQDGRIETHFANVLAWLGLACGATTSLFMYT
jgi:hypothetical protein